MEDRKRMLAMIAEQAKAWKADAARAKFSAPPTTDPDSLLKGGPSYKSSELANLQPGSDEPVAPASDYAPPEAADVSAMTLPTAPDALNASATDQLGDETLAENKRVLGGLDEERMKTLLASLKR